MCFIQENVCVIKILLFLLIEYLLIHKWCFEMKTQFEAKLKENASPVLNRGLIFPTSTSSVLFSESPGALLVLFKDYIIFVFLTFSLECKSSISTLEVTKLPTVSNSERTN